MTNPPESESALDRLIERDALEYAEHDQEAIAELCALREDIRHYEEAAHEWRRRCDEHDRVSQDRDDLRLIALSEADGGSRRGGDGVWRIYAPASDDRWIECPDRWDGLPDIAGEARDVLSAYYGPKIEARAALRGSR